jgi:hypothetical protein
MILAMPFIATCTMPLRRRWQQFCHFHPLEPEISSINSISVQIQTSKPVKLPWRKEDCFGADYGSPSVQSITIALAFARMQEKKEWRVDPIFHLCIPALAVQAPLNSQITSRFDWIDPGKPRCPALPGSEATCPRLCVSQHQVGRSSPSTAAHSNVFRTVWLAMACKPRSIMTSRNSA